MSVMSSASIKKQMSPQASPNANISHRIAVVFPGQGAQTVGMLGELAKIYPLVQQTFNEASEALGFDLWAVCQDDAQLAKTEYTQPALLTASMAIWRIIQDNLTVEPLFLAGHSLGEYSALCASGALSLADAVNLVYVRGQYMQDAVVGLDTKMAAILGLEDNQVMSICEQINDDDAFVSPANFNSTGQVVVAGNAQGMDALNQHIQCMGKKMVPLKVSVPSHCALMTPAAEALAPDLQAVKLLLPQIPVIQNRHAEVEKTVATIKQALIEQLSHPVLWTQTMQKLSDKHINLLIECGAGTVLSNLAKRQESPIITYPTDKPVRLTKLIEALS